MCERHKASLHHECFRVQNQESFNCWGVCLWAASVSLKTSSDELLKSQQHIYSAHHFKSGDLDLAQLMFQFLSGLKIKTRPSRVNQLEINVNVWDRPFFISSMNKILLTPCHQLRLRLYIFSLKLSMSYFVHMHPRDSHSQRLFLDLLRLICT